MRLDLSHIQRWIAPGSRVLDLGCADGEFLQTLRDQRQVRGTGIEIDQHNINQAIGRGLNIIEQDMDKGLGNFPDQSFDTVVLAHALQAVHYPDRVLDEMLRIGRQGIVTFPNFGHWKCRLYLGVRGRMPVSKFMPYTWYNTPNIHFCTIRDFADLCAELNAGVERRIALGAHGRPMSLDRSAWLANLLAEQAVFVLHRAGVTEPGRVRPRPGSTPAPD